MTLTGHWHRIDERVYKLWPRSILEQEKQAWEKRRIHFRTSIYAHILSGGNIHRDREWAFEFVARQSIAAIQDKMNMIDALMGKLSDN
jgi:hypothetical protein